jgi:glucan phosphorylase
LVAGPQPLVELGPRLHQPVSRSESDALAQLNQNPISLLSEMPLGEIERRATNWCCTAASTTCYRRQQEYLRRPHLGRGQRGVLRPRPVAYFSAEFGLHESLPIYSGGLGVLAGDHIKSASDLDIPLVGIGLVYGQGYFLQRLDQSGWQREEYLQTDVNQLAHAAGHRRRTASRWWWRFRRAAARSAPRCGD